MTTSDKDLRKYMDDLAASQDEITDAMIARKGEKGKEYSDIVIQAASTAATITYLVTVHEMSDDEVFMLCSRHAIACVITHAMSLVSTLYNLPEFTSIKDPLFVEFTCDMNALAGKMLGRIKA